MALNTSHAGGGVLIFNSERILIFYDGVEMSFDMTCGMQHFKGTKKGRVYLTTHRVIFNSKDNKNLLQSFSMPFYTMKEVELEQPIFGANYIKGKVLPEAGGHSGWDGNGRFKMWFTNGGAIEFGQAMLHAGRMATRRMPPQPPVYTPPSGPYYQAPPPAYAPPQGPVYGFVPYATFPTAPPADGVYMMDAPPPYPGIDPSAPVYTPPPQTNGWHPAPGQPAPGYPGQAAPGYPAPGYPADAKAQEAAGSAYYNPANPHNVYMPAPPPGQHPPPYSEVGKKNQ